MSYRQKQVQFDEDSLYDGGDLDRRHSGSTFEFDGTESMFDINDRENFFAGGRQVTTYFVQAKSSRPIPGMRTFYKSWELCYVHVVVEGDEVMLQLAPSESRPDVTQSPRVFLWLQGDALKVKKSRMFVLMKVGHFTIQALSRVEDAPVPETEQVEEWSFASFGLSSEIDDKLRAFAKQVCDAKGWKTLNTKGDEISISSLSSEER
ncbi:hypothetical protein MNV49_001560 [Pseudohyphozyma bogoriensis]|nr:hypothetical protein MNV49_001560 [Pseudohyphozyma bogoriensis]